MPPGVPTERGAELFQARAEALGRRRNGRDRVLHVVTAGQGRREAPGEHPACEEIECGSGGAAQRRSR